MPNVLRAVLALMAGAAVLVGVAAGSGGSSAAKSEGAYLLSTKDLTSRWDVVPPPSGTLRTCIVSAVSSPKPISTSSMTFGMRPHGGPEIVEYVRSYANPVSAYSSMETALNRCGNHDSEGVSIGNDKRFANYVEVDPSLAPYFVGSCAYVHRATTGSSNHYQALVLARRSTHIVTLIYIDQGTLKTSEIRSLEGLALAKVPG
jgi:hypothetical protein